MEKRFETNIYIRYFLVGKGCRCAATKSLPPSCTEIPRVRLPMGSLGVFIDLILLTALWLWSRLDLWQKLIPVVWLGG